MKNGRAKKEEKKRAGVEVRPIKEMQTSKGIMHVRTPSYLEIMRIISIKASDEVGLTFRSRQFRIDSGAK